MDTKTPIETMAEIQKETLNHIKKMFKLNELLTTPPTVRTGQTPWEIVYRKHKTKLIHYINPASQYKTPVFITFALVNKPYILDLIPGKSVVEYLVKAGLDVYMLDWGIPSDSDADKGLDQYINLYMDTMVDKIREFSGCEKISLMGYCMGGTMSLIYSALHPEKIRNLIVMATPFDFSIRDGLLFRWSKEFPVEELTDLYGNCPGWYLDLSFLSLKPLNPLDKGVNLYKNILDDKFMELFMAMEKWSADSQPVPGKAYREFVRYCFQQNLLIQNRLEIGGETVDLSRIQSPLLNIIAQRDHLVPPSSSMEIGTHIGSDDKEIITCDTGHIGLSVSGKAFKQVWNKVSQWLIQRSEVRG